MRFVKYTFRSGLCWDAFTPVSFKFDFDYRHDQMQHFDTSLNYLNLLLKVTGLQEKLNLCSYSIL